MEDFNENLKVANKHLTEGIIQEELLNNPDAILLYAQEQRVRLLKGVLSLGIPTKAMAQQVLFGAIKDMEATALGRKKLKVEEMAEANKEVTNALLSDVLKKISFSSTGVNTNVYDITPTLPVLEDNLTELEIKPDELKQGVIIDNYDNFIQRQAAV